jgi:hypothetical protein
MSDSKQLRNPYPPDPQRGGTPWTCVMCKYNLNIGKFCINCGRDHWGTEKGEKIHEEDKPHRPSLRGA